MWLKRLLASSRSPHYFCGLEALLVNELDDGNDLIHLMRSGEIEANLVQLNESFKLPYIHDLIERKTTRTETGTLENSDLEFHEREYERLKTELEQAFEESRLPEQPRGAEALNALLVRVRMGQQSGG